jgi:hypothetical protein
LILQAVKALVRLANKDDRPDLRYAKEGECVNSHAGQLIAGMILGSRSLLIPTI